MVHRIAVGILGRPRHDSIDACGSLYQKALTIWAWPFVVKWGEPSVPQIATPNRMAAATEDVSADVVLTEIKTRVEGDAQDATIQRHADWHRKLRAVRWKVQNANHTTDYLRRLRIIRCCARRNNERDRAARNTQ